MIGVITVGSRCESVEVRRTRPARASMEGADDLPPDDEGDAAGPAALLRAAAELIVDEAERGRTLDAAAALLELIPTEDLEETVLAADTRIPAVAGEEAPTATMALPVLNSSQSWHVHFEALSARGTSRWQRPAEARHQHAGLNGFLHAEALRHVFFFSARVCVSAASRASHVCCCYSKQHGDILYLSMLGP